MHRTDGFMGWADKAIWKHVTGLIGATLHKCEDREKNAGETLKQQQQPVAHPQSRSALQTRQDTSADNFGEKKTYVTYRKKKLMVISVVMT